MRRFNNKKQSLTRNGIGVFMAAAAVLATPQIARATDYTWVGGGSNIWSTASNWSPRGIPDGDDTVFIGGQSMVNVSTNVTVRNLRLGSGARISNGARVTVTGWTDSDGIVSGAGLIDIPKGATATFELGFSSAPQAQGFSKTSQALTQATPIQFGKLENSGKVNIRVSSTVNVGFQDIVNDGGNTVLSASGTSPTVRLIRRSSSVCQTASPIRLKLLKNTSGSITLAGTGARGRAFLGEAIDNHSQMTFDAAHTLVQGDYNNRSGSTVTLKQNSLVKAVSGTAPKFENYGLVRQVDGNSSVHLEWYNAGRVEIENGSLTVVPPEGKPCAQIGGSTTLLNGTLEVMDSSSDPQKRGLLLEGGTLNGSGTIIGDVRNSGGRIQVGHSPGLIIINGNYTQTSNGTLDMEIWGTAPGTQYDQMRVEGDAYLGGTLNLVTGNNFVAGSGNAFMHMTYIERIGSFAKINIVNPVAGRTYRTTYATTGVMSTTVLTTNPTPTPTPVTPPSIAVASPARNALLKNLTTLNGTASGGSSALSGVKVMLYRYANDRVSAGYWAGTNKWSSTLSTTNQRATIVSGGNWNLPISGLMPARYMLRATATNAKNATATSPDISFWINTGNSSLTLSTATGDATRDSIRLAFTHALDITTGRDTSRYTVHINGRLVSVASVTYGIGNAVKLQLPANSLAPGDSVAIKWTNLFTPTGSTLSGTTTLTAS